MAVSSCAVWRGKRLLGLARSQAANSSSDFVSAALVEGHRVRRSWIRPPAFTGGFWHFRVLGRQVPARTAAGCAAPSEFYIQSRRWKRGSADWSRSLRSPHDRLQPFGNRGRRTALSGLFGGGMFARVWQYLRAIVEAFVADDALSRPAEPGCHAWLMRVSDNCLSASGDAWGSLGSCSGISARKCRRECHPTV
jgi:hypothetical protein